MDHYSPTCEYVSHPEVKCLILVKAKCNLKITYDNFINTESESDYDSESINSTTQNLPYDYKSVMHFKCDDLDSRRGLNTLARISTNRKRPETLIRVSDTPTQLDYLHINLLYCGGTIRNIVL